MASIINATTSTGLVSSADNSGSLQLATNNGTTAVTINTSQQIGIGTTSPAAPLDVVSDSNSSAISVRGRSADNLSAIRIYSNNGATQYGVIRGASDELRVNATEAIPLTFYTNNSERMRIDSAGNVLVGTTSVDGKLNVSYPSGGNGCKFVLTNSSAANNVIVFNNTNGTVGFIQMNGSNTSYNTSSDYRLKENITPMTGALATVQALKPVTYTWKADSSNGQGFIAHELQEVVPDCVTGEKDAVDAEGKPIHQAIDTSFLVATLTSAIQELNEKVEAQAVRIAELEGAK